MVSLTFNIKKQIGFKSPAAEHFWLIFSKNAYIFKKI